MKIEWIVSDADIKRLKGFTENNHNPFVQTRISRNVEHKGLVISKDSLIKGIMMCLLTSQQRSGPNTSVSNFLLLRPFPIMNETFQKAKNVESFIASTLQKNGLTRFINKISKAFAYNHNLLLSTDWVLLETFRKELLCQTNPIGEKQIADWINNNFKGFGPKQSRNLLQSLGLSKYEIPIDSRITSWLNDFGFPVTLSSTALQDKGYYGFVMDGIKHLCDRAEIFPCVLDAAIFSSFDDGGWNEENMVY